jgi:exo-1,4-beta-D-glucosaminidase
MFQRLLLVFAVFCLGSQSFAQNRLEKIQLHEGWGLQSACKIDAKGDTISTPSYKATGWHATTVPNTVVAVLVTSKVYPDPFYGMNLRSIPGANYPLGTQFIKEPMPEDSPFRCAWWYRTAFRLPTANAAKKTWLHFDGINYRANIWLNGQRIATTEQVAGAYRTYEFEVSQQVQPGKMNVLAVEVTAQTENDLGVNWVDWNPVSPDKNMGLWRDVYLTRSGPVALRAPHVLTKLDVKTLDSAELTINAELSNVSDTPVSGELLATIEKITVKKPVQLQAGEIKNVSLTAAEFAQLRITKPRIWWPVRMGKQDMYVADLAFKVGAETSDKAAVKFGIREVTSELTDKGFRLFKVNGKNILIRGGGWAPDMLLRSSPKRQEQELQYVLDLGLNTVRLEGTMETDHLYDLADKMGILLMPGWCCCSIWEEWEKWTPQHKTIATESLRSQLIRLRNHPSVFVWLNGSDNPPPAEIEQAYLDVEKELNWPNPTLSSATAKPGPVTGPSGVKMTGPYEYVPPTYWYADTAQQHGGGYGFNTETSPGPAPMVAESIQRTIPKENWWPPNDVWNFHAGSSEFKNISIFNNAMESRYGKPESLVDYDKRAQVMTYEGQRAMFEAYSHNKYTSTGVIQWMLNNAWPGMIWHLYDYYLVPGGGYFGSKKALEPLHVLYNYGDRSVHVVNSLQEPYNGVKVNATVYNLDLAKKFTKEVGLDIAADTSVKALEIPALEGLSEVYFVKLELLDQNNKPLSSNFYWLSTKPDTFDWSKTTFFVTPNIESGDLKALNTLPPVELSASSTHAQAATGKNSIAVTVANPTKSLAFSVHLKLKNTNGEMVSPVFMDDNYFPLMPGEKRTISIRYDSENLKGKPVVELAGWNVKAVRLNPRPPKSGSSGEAD